MNLVAISIALTNIFTSTTKLGYYSLEHEVARTILGWILLFLGIAGIIANLVLLVMASTFPPALIVNTLFCLLFILGGWRLSHPKQMDRAGGIVK